MRDVYDKDHKEKSGVQRLVAQLLSSNLPIVTPFNSRRSPCYGPFLTSHPLCCQARVHLPVSSVGLVSLSARWAIAECYCCAASLTTSLGCRSPLTRQGLLVALTTTGILTTLVAPVDRCWLT